MITLFLPVTAADSQDQENLMDQEELILESDENTRIPAEIFEERQDLCLQPVDLNSASREELESSGLFTPFQVNVIIEYRERHGDLFSIYELASLTGFRVAR
jgi:DNA uptake protein ComE-like DNA-binding protein